MWELSALDAPQVISAFSEEDIVDVMLGLRLKEHDMLWSSDDEDEDSYL